MRLTNAPTNASRAMTNDSADAYANAPTNDTDARRTRPPHPPERLCAFARAFYPPANTGFASLASRSQAHDRTSHDR
jgi:hypothetical protein